MGLSIQEQLLKAGLVDQKQVKKANHEKRVQNKKKKKGEASSDDSAGVRLKQQREAQAKKDQQLNAERNRRAQREADQAAAQQLIETNRLPVEEGPVAYHYVGDGGTIKRISVTRDVADKLAEGLMGLAVYKRDVVMIPAETVLKVLERDKDSIVTYNDPAQAEDDYPTDW
ncbi:MAG: DUF2058 domain-containing protein [Desulfuromonas sp.]|uniref:DUF2058 domain-containing protein n=1 Tax=Desulfuromonas sp. TaxID=892 RepID=UPI000CC4778D|nr:DUF2058 family protein [Desulfuromonas sp.]PLX82408.1 MAG: DUF2058 domain-containing protein [Desulfuromonas sp.]